MSLSRRRVMEIGGGSLAALILDGRAIAAASSVEIVMSGSTDGAKVWFDPAGVHVRPGGIVRWINRDAGNTHSATAYHPANKEHQLRIPSAAEPWDSGYLLPGDSFSQTLHVPGVYDYFCIPHELAGMVGRIVVAAEGGAIPQAAEGIPVPGMAENPFPAVDRILREGVVAG